MTTLVMLNSPAGEISTSKKNMNINEAIKKIKSEAKAKFVESVETHINLVLDAKSQAVRTTINLPHGTGKELKIVVIAVDYDSKLEKEFSDVKFGNEDMIKDIVANKIKTSDFDLIISTPATMTKLASIARILGPLGLMPNPKSGTVVDPAKLSKSIATFKKGRVEIRTQHDLPIIHASIGRVTFTEEQLVENFNALFDAVKVSKPAKTKPDWIKSVFVSTTMGKGVKVEV